MFENNNIVILGMARSGYEVAKYLAKRHNKITINDLNTNQNEEHIKELEKLGVKIVLGSHPDDLITKDVNYLIKNPGVPIDHKYVLKAKELGIEVLNEVEVSARLMRKDVHLIGITGTNGKTTTTTIIYEILKEKFKDKVHLTGNMGYPLISFLDKFKKDDFIVMETSSQQLENLDRFTPEVAVLTNVSEAHLEFFKTYDHYKELKKRIFKNHTKDNLAIINRTDEESLKLTKDIKSNKVYFSDSKDDLCYIEKENIYYKGKKIIDTKEIILKGMHNYQNIMAAIIVAKHYGVEDEIINKVVKKFKGVEHRLEFVKELDGKKYYNDSKATNLVSTQIALKSFDKDILLILGGYERGQDFKELIPYLDNVKVILAIGENRERVKKELSNYNVIVKETLKEAMKNIKDYDVDIVLLSPASASWDQYKKFEDRGEEFKNIVNSL
ncbi:MAG: UDP-N-acetylmuramoyl-L-alanine--D-glutamate ligase [Clostridiales bacterium]|nr:UDP-N-acetylmuramoyl-L-alanine--D-glutamate ligase [Clostridiales bacterium]